MTTEMFIARSTPELPTRWDGQKVQLLKRGVFGHKDFCKVLIWSTGDTSILHESQLQTEEDYKWLKNAQR